jgi:hypothetical protein
MSKRGISHVDTPRKARIKGAAEFMDAMGIQYFKTDLFNFHNVSRQQGYAILAESEQADDRRLEHHLYKPETRGRKLLLSQDQIREADRFLQDVGWEACIFTWGQLAHELDFGVSGRTMKRAMGSMDYHKCVACTKGWVSKRVAKKRVEYAETALQNRPKSADWHNVRFSDEVHCCVGLQGKLCIIQKPGERYCSDCIQEQLNWDDEREWETLHIWGAVGHNFKSDLTFYKTPGNKNVRSQAKDS